MQIPLREVNLNSKDLLQNLQDTCAKETGPLKLLVREKRLGEKPIHGDDAAKLLVGSDALAAAYPEGIEILTEVVQLVHIEI